MIALVAGHSYEHPGARASGEREHDLALRLAQQVQLSIDAMGQQTALLTRPPGFYRAAIGAVVDAANALQPAAVIAFHLDALDGRHRGSVGLYWPGSERGQALAEALAAASAEALGIPCRGAIAQARAWRESDTRESGPTGLRLEILGATSAPACILEVGYLDEPSDRGRIVMAAQGIRGPWADGVAEALVGWMA